MELITNPVWDSKEREYEDIKIYLLKKISYLMKIRMKYPITLKMKKIEEKITSAFSSSDSYLIKGDVYICELTVLLRLRVHTSSTHDNISYTGGVNPQAKQKG